MPLFGGIDIGSTTSELVVINENKEIIFWDKCLTAGKIKTAINSLFEKCFDTLAIKREDLKKVVATGYGRKHVTFADNDITEISCYAKGAYHLNRDVRTVIDIGGQDSKVIVLTDTGDVEDFAMNDKCAAGTGRFLEIIAGIFNLQLDELGEISRHATKAVAISSICAVFAESEVISLVSNGVEPADIINAIHYSVCERIQGLANRLQVRHKIMFCGGVACNSGMERTLKEILDVKEFYLPENKEIVGALGASLFACS